MNSYFWKEKTNQQRHLCLKENISETNTNFYAIKKKTYIILILRF